MLPRAGAVTLIIQLTFYGDTGLRFWSSIIYAGASITDVLDGWLARRKEL
jgi:phosphatidylglycerophosphate synthase